MQTFCLLLFLVGYINATNISLPITKRYPQGTRLKKRIQYNSSLFNDDGSEYLIEIGVGTPVQNFTVSLDTGSADLWIPSIECPKEQCPLSRFNASQSSTFEKTTSLFHVEYGIGSVNGTYGKDHVYLGGAHVPQQLFGLASSTRDLILVTSTNTKEIANGIFGLGHPSLTRRKVKYEPFLFQLAKQGLIDSAIFSISMGSRTEEGWSGEMVIGGTNEAKYVGEIEYADVMSNSSYWMVGGQSIEILHEKEKNVVYNATFDGVRGMIIDTGTTLSYVDPVLAQEIVLQVAGAENNKVALDHMSGTYIIHCQEPRFRDQTLRINLENGIVLNIPMLDLIIPLEGKNLEESTQCMFGIAPWMSTGTSDKMNKNGWILIGDSILRSTYLVFDMQENRVGFAKASSMVSQQQQQEQQQQMVSPGNKISPLWLLTWIIKKKKSLLGLFELVRA